MHRPAAAQAQALEELQARGDLRAGDVFEEDFETAGGFDGDGGALALLLLRKGRMRYDFQGKGGEQTGFMTWAASPITRAFPLT